MSSLSDLTRALDEHRADHHAMNLSRDMPSAETVYLMLVTWAEIHHNGLSRNLDRCVDELVAEERGKGQRRATLERNARRMVGYWFASDVYSLPTLTPTYILSRVSQAPIVWAAARLYLDAVGAVSKPTGPVYLAQYIGTTNDTNGNPRRGWYVSRIDGSEETTWIEEGYGNFPWSAFADKLGMPAAEGEAWHSVRDRVRPFVKETGKIDVTPGEYRDARKLPRFARTE